MNECVSRKKTVLLFADIKGIFENHRVEQAGQSYCKEKNIHIVIFKKNKKKI